MVELPRRSTRTKRRLENRLFFGFRSIEFKNQIGRNSQRYFWVGSLSCERYVIDPLGFQIFRRLDFPITQLVGLARCGLVMQFYKLVNDPIVYCCPRSTATCPLIAVGCFFAVRVLSQPPTKAPSPSISQSKPPPNWQKF